jgi:hypothetical protein
MAGRIVKQAWRAAMVAVLPVLGACSSIISGASQQITVNTNPAGAACALYREGNRIAMVESTPGTVHVVRTKDSITVLCVKPGYEQVTYLNRSGIEGSTYGNMIAGGLVGWAIDSRSGADNKYESPLNITLLPLQPGSTQVSQLPTSVPYTPPPPRQ